MKVISFCLWGNKLKYNVGAVNNARIASEIFPDWICRFYVGDTAIQATVDLLLEMENVEVIRVNKPGDWRMMFDRFYPILDDNVEVMLSRDCDSRLSLREKSAVDEWLNSDKSFHTIHDHFHHTVPILGGLFGMRKGAVPDFKKKLDAVTDRCGVYWQVDQEFLSNEIWPIVSGDTLNHAEFHTNMWPGVPIPIPRNGREFIGATYDERNEIDFNQKESLYG